MDSFVSDNDVAVPDNDRLASAAPMGGKKARKMEKPQVKRRENGRFGAIQNPGELVERRPLSGWEAYAQALLFSNELAYFN